MARLNETILLDTVAKNLVASVTEIETETELYLYIHLKIKS